MDAWAENVKTAARHAIESGLEIDDRHATAEQLAEAGEVFDAVLNMEVVEHVADASAFLAACGERARLAAPGWTRITGDA